MACALSDTFLSALVAEFADETTEAAALSGSFARGDADAYSDVDLVLYGHDRPTTRRGRERLVYRAGRLVSVDAQSFADRFADLRQPADAVIAVPAIRRLRVLLDRDGSLAALIQAARDFAWSRCRRRRMTTPASRWSAWQRSSTRSSAGWRRTTTSA